MSRRFPLPALLLLPVLGWSSLSLQAQEEAGETPVPEEGRAAPDSPADPPAGRRQRAATKVPVREGELIDLDTFEPKPVVGPVLELGLEDALQLALSNNLDLELEKLATERAEYDVHGSWGAFDPVYSLSGSYNDREIPLGSQSQQGFQVSAPVLKVDSLGLNTSLGLPLQTGGFLSASYDRANTDSSGNVLTSDTLSFNLGQPLLRGAWSRFATHDQRQAQISLERQRQVEQEARQRMLRDVYVAYWDLVSAREELRVREQAVGLGLRQLEQDERRLEVGAGTEVDVLQSQTNVAQQEELRIQAEFGLRAAEDALRTLLFAKAGELDERYLSEWDWPVVPLTELPEEIAPDPGISWLASLDRAVRNRPTLWQVRLDVDAAELRLARQRTDRLPQLDLNVGVDSRAEDPDPEQALEQTLQFDLLSTRASLEFSIPIGNRARANAVRAARSDLRAARLAYDRQELGILAEVRTAVRNLRFAAEAVAAARTSLQLAQRQLQAEQARREIGLSTTFQVLEFQQDLVEARSAAVTARTNWMKARAGLRHAEGLLTPDPDDLDRPEPRQP